MSTTTITITIDHATGAVTTRTGGAAPRPRSEPLPRATGTLRTDGNTSIPRPGRKGGNVCDAEDKDLEWWRDKIAAGLAAEPDGRYAANNSNQLAAIETEMARRQGGGADDFPPDDFGTGGRGTGGGGNDDDIPFGRWDLP